MSVAKAWTPEEDATLRAMYLTRTRLDIGTALGRSEGSVSKRCKVLRLNGKLKPWTKAEADALFSFYVEHVNKAFPPDGLAGFAKRLGRTTAFVCRKAGELGLTDADRKMRDGAAEEYSARVKEWHRTHEHPRGALGIKHSEDRRQRMSDSTTALHRAGRFGNCYTRCAGGARADLGDTYFRSRWEANYARYLNLLVGQGKIAAWLYEPQLFEFHTIKRGTRSYTPDFKVIAADGSYEWHEVKGWMDQKSRTRLARMAKFYPTETVKVIGKSWFSAARRSIAPLLNTWEYGDAKAVTAASQRPPRHCSRRAVAPAGKAARWVAT